MTAEGAPAKASAARTGQRREGAAGGSRDEPAQGERRGAISGPVVVIDDDLPFIRMVERMLAIERIRAQPITTLDVDEAIAIVESSGCRAVLIDVYMYGETLGFTLIERLRAHPPTAHIPLIVTSSARREIGRKVGFLQARACEVLLKPFAHEELIARVAGTPAGPCEAAPQAPIVALPPAAVGHQRIGL